LKRAMPDVQPEIITTFAGVRPLLHSNADPFARSREHQIVREGANLISVAGGKYTTYRAIAEDVLKLIHPGKSRTATTPLPQHRPQLTGEKIAAAPMVFESDIVHACDYEMALTLSDVMRRRTSLALSRHGGLDVAEGVARIMAPLHGWNETQCREQISRYVAERSAGTL
jgi:glycerol-3-phosphate dehydrogenase